MQATEAGRGRKEPLDRRTPGGDRDLGAGRESQRGFKQKSDVSHRIDRVTICVHI